MVAIFCRTEVVICITMFPTTVVWRPFQIEHIHVSISAKMRFLETKIFQIFPFFKRHTYYISQGLGLFLAFRVVLMFLNTSLKSQNVTCNFSE